MKSWGIYLVIGLGFIVYDAVTKADRDNSGAIVGEGSVNAFQVRVGDCFNDSGSLEEISSLPGVPCSEPHDNETFAVIDLTVATYPEGDAMAELAQGSCIERFESFVGTDYESSALDVLAMFPTPESWKQDDREVICAVYKVDSSKLVGGAEGLAL